MKEYIFLALNIIFTIALYHYIYEPQKDYLAIGSELKCLDNGEAKTLCAQCVSRSESMDHSKGYLINSSNVYAVLKFPNKRDYISCTEAIHLVDYTNHNSVSITFEKQQIIGQLLSELDTAVVFSKNGSTTVEPRYESFIVYGWYESNDKVARQGIDILVVNELEYKSVLVAFYKIVNLLVLLMIIGKILVIKLTKQRQENDPANYLIVAQVVALYLLTTTYFQVNHSIVFYFIRIISLVLPVLRVEVRRTYLLMYTLLGLLMAWNPLTLAVYAYLGWLLVMIGGWDKLNVEPIWRYLMASQLAVAVNYMVWYLLYEYVADYSSMIIEFAQLAVNLLAIALITDRRVRKFKEYVPSDQKPIYLTGYDEEEEMVVRT